MGSLSSVEDVATLVRDGDTVGFGGSPTSRKPILAARALAAAGRCDLELVAFTGSLEVEILVAAGCLRLVRSSHVSLGPLGRAERFTRAVETGQIGDLEESEWMLLGGLRAAAAGMPFLPSRAAWDSELARLRGLREVVDPYGGRTYLAIPALEPDVAFIHAWRADARGNVQLPWPPDHLFDVDLLLARSARTTIVTVERIVSEATIRASSARTALFSFEVDALIEAPEGAFPTASPPDYEADPRRVHALLASLGDGERPASGADRDL